MADPKFSKNVGPFTLETLVTISGASLSEGCDPSLMINDVQALDAASEKHISFMSNPKYLAQFQSSKAGACIVSPQNAGLAPKGMALVISNNPYKTFAKISQHFYPVKPSDGIIHPTAVIADTATLGKNVSIGAYCVIEDGVVIGDNSVIDAQCFIGENCTIGADCRINAQVTVRNSEMGDNVSLYCGARIGEDGFGFAPDPMGHVKIPQLGRVIIGTSVEIGANTTVDRGSGPDTVIGDGCWLDNMCQIAHNVRLGKGCIIASQTGISGSTTLEDFVVVGGQVGFAGHITIGMGTQISAKSGVISSIPPGQVYAGYPAAPKREFFKSIAVLRKIAKSKGPNK